MKRQTLFRTLRVLVLVLSPLQAAAADRWLLVPIITSGPIHGAYGSLFATRMTVRNSSQASVTLRGLVPSCENLSPCPDWTDLRLGPSETVDVWPSNFAAMTSRFVQIPGRDGRDIQMRLSVSDLSRTDRNAGTELPIIDENELRPRITILNISDDPRYRHTLRVYSRIESSIVARMYRRSSGDVYPVAFEVQTRKQNPVDELEPAQAVVFGLPFASGLLTSEYYLELESRDGTPLWAFVTVTNNQTQLITSHTPSRLE